MALMRCPECGKEVSDTAVQCPNCGKPFGKQIMKGSTNNLKMLACFLFGFAGIMFGGLLTFYSLIFSMFGVTLILLPFGIASIAGGVFLIKRGLKKKREFEDNPTK